MKTTMEMLIVQIFDDVYRARPVRTAETLKKYRAIGAVPLTIRTITATTHTLGHSPPNAKQRNQLIPGIHRGRKFVSVRCRVQVVQQLHVSAVQVRIQTGLVLRSVSAEGTVKLWFHAALVLQMPRQTGVVIVHLAAVLARIGDSLTVQVAHRPRL